MTGPQDDFDELSDIELTEDDVDAMIANSTPVNLVFVSPPVISVALSPIDRTNAGRAGVPAQLIYDPLRAGAGVLV